MFNSSRLSLIFGAQIIFFLLASSPTFAQPQESTFDGIEFVRISSGTFTMGSADDQLGRATSEKRRKVPIEHDFWMGKYEVTQAQWEGVMGYNPSTFKSLGPVQSHPVETVTWHQVQEFIDTLNQNAGGQHYRLPTEAEWEYVAKASTFTRWSFGDLDAQLVDFAHRDGDHRPRARGGKQPNAWGVHDLYGNVYEWCEDWYQVSRDVSKGACPPESGTYKVIRGGSNGAIQRYLRSSSRNLAHPDRRGYYIGFRLIRVDNQGGDDFRTGSACVPSPFCGDHSVTAGEECDDGNVDDGDGCSNTCQVEGGALEGDVNANKVRDATVDVIDLETLEVLASTTTDDQGHFRVVFADADPTGKLLDIKVTGGTYRDEATDEDKTLGELSTITYYEDEQEPDDMIVTPVSTLLREVVKAELQQGTATPDKQTLDRASQRLSEAFGFEEDLRTFKPITVDDFGDPQAVDPQEATEVREKREAFGLLLANLSGFVDHYRKESRGDASIKEVMNLQFKELIPYEDLVDASEEVTESSVDSVRERVSTGHEVFVAGNQRREPDRRIPTDELEEVQDRESVNIAVRTSLKKEIINGELTLDNFKTKFTHPGLLMVMLDDPSLANIAIEVATLPDGQALISNVEGNDETRVHDVVIEGIPGFQDAHILIRIEPEHEGQVVFIRETNQIARSAQIVVGEERRPTNRTARQDNIEEHCATSDVDFICDANSERTYVNTCIATLKTNIPAQLLVPCGINVNPEDIPQRRETDLGITPVVRGHRIEAGSDLSGADLSDSDLHGTDLNGADLNDADLSGADLGDSDLRDADLRNSDLHGADLNGADLNDADLSGADLGDSSLRDADLRGADLRGASLVGVDLEGADLEGANFEDADMRGIDLTNVNIGFAARFRRAQLCDVILSGTFLPAADLVGADLCRADLFGADLTGADLTEVTLNNANLSRTDLFGANLSRAELTEVLLTEANLTEANLTEANLTEANLTEANLTSAIISFANFASANLEGANLSFADVTGANFIGAHIDNVQTDFILEDATTTCPDGTNSDVSCFP